MPVGTTAQVFVVLSVVFLGSIATLLIQPSYAWIVALPLLFSGVWLGTFILTQGLQACLAGVKALARNTSSLVYIPVMSGVVNVVIAIAAAAVAFVVVAVLTRRQRKAL